MNDSEPGSSGAPRFEDVLPIADAVLYEGYLLYPYRPSSLKNRVRWTFGGVYPRTYSQAQTGADRCEVSTECLVRGAQAELVIEARFLELMEQKASHTLEEAESRSFRCELGLVSALVGVVTEHAFPRGRLRASLEVSVQAVAHDVFRLRACLRNESNSPAVERAAALPDTLLAAHLLLGVENGELVSQLDPPAELRAAARACQQHGLWPVLAGQKQRTNQMLASPIILYDYPEVAPESRADSCDATEIDEILLLRVLTLSDEEKRELRAGDPRATAILERAEALSAEELLRLHGRLHKPMGEPPAFSVGERVVLRPKARADIFDLALAGRIATVRAIQQDFEDRVHLSVTVDDDPGADLGIEGLPGHRFFFFTDEVERIGEGSAP
ncbi:MAG TPA: hypothetical protein VK745_10155 [Polyangiaceae bacterium]|nr:hypothetical protein [Polyangiaceae bacterium]